MRSADRARARPGAVLLEVLFAVAILATAGVTIVSLAAESARAVERTRGAERDLRAANAFLSAVALWPRADLDRHLGDRRQGRWIMRVDRARPDLYAVSLRDSATRALVLGTSLYRAEAPRAKP
jgi:type II secretory pathway pseudopilin PulG